jgi:hypothetical protein
VQAYVYNYSQDTGTGPFTVRFSYAPHNADLNDGAPDLTTIGDVTVDNLPYRNSQEGKSRKAVSVKWEIPEDLAGEKIVIYVTLDPDNEVKDEIHELYVADQSPTPTGTCPVGKGAHSAECGIFCASNNQGYWPWENGIYIMKTPSNSEEDTTVPLELGFESESLEVEPTSRSEGSGPWIFTNMEYRLKVVIDANRTDTTFRDVMFYDNDKFFSMKRSFGLHSGENDFYCRWTPNEPGQHTLKVEIIQDEDDPEPGNNIITLDVEVLDHRLPAHR